MALNALATSVHYGNMYSPSGWQAVAESCWLLGENGCKVGATLKASLFGWYQIAMVDCMKDCLQTLTN